MCTKDLSLDKDTKDLLKVTKNFNFEVPKLEFAKPEFIDKDNSIDHLHIKSNFKVDKLNLGINEDGRFIRPEDTGLEDIMSHIRKALIEADNNYIKSNMIIIDRDLAITNHLLVPHYNYDGKITNYSNCNPMMFGRAVKYQKNLTKDLAANFVITQGPDTDRVKALEEENARLKEQLNQIKELLNI